MPSPSPLQPVRLRLANVASPLGIDDAPPVLHWDLPEDGPGSRPSFQIEAADSEEALQNGSANRWKTPWLRSTTANEMTFGGPAGKSRERIWWRVRLRWSGNRVSEWSTPDWWEYGLLSRDEWEAAWITSQLCGDAETGAPSPFFRKEFSLAGAPIRARLRITALGLYECHINGRIVSPDVFTPGWTDYRVRTQVQTYDVTDLLSQGANAIGVILGDGWYCGRISNKTRQQYGDRPALLARLEIEMADGSRSTVVTGPGWQYAPGPIIQNDLLTGETYDARRELGNWSSPLADSGIDWSEAIILPSPAIEISPSPGPRVRRREVYRLESPTAAGTGSGRTVIHDVGQNIAGRVRFTVRAPAGCEIRVRHGEMLKEDGSLYVANLRRASATDIYICKGGGEESWEPRFTFHGFRYVEISFSSEKAEILAAEAVCLRSDVEETGDFSCSSSLLNRFFSNVRWSTWGNFLEVPTDCPQRDERLGWTGDAQVFAPTAAFLADVRTFFSKWMIDVRDAQRPDGAIASVAPAVDVRAGNDAGPGWSDAVIICPWEIYQACGDTRILEQNYPAMRRYMDYLLAEQCKDGIRCHPDLKLWDGHGDWLALDGGVDREGNTPKDLIGTAFLAHSLDLLARIAAVLGDAPSARAYRSLHQRTGRAFRRRFVTRDHLLTGNTQTSCVLPLRFGLLTGESRRRAVDELVKNITKRSYHLTTGFLGTPFLCEVLSECGHLDVAYKLLEQTTFPSWLFPVTNGATTIWERWDGWTPEKGFQNPYMNSFNHYAYGAVAAWMVRTVAGLRFSPWQSRGEYFTFCPQPGGSLTHAQARWRTVRGTAAIRWEKTGTDLRVELEVPVGSTGRFAPPPGHAGGPRVFGPGSHALMVSATPALT